MTMLDMIAFDADDTLWHMESLFHLTHEKYAAMLSHYHSAKWIEKKLFETEMRNLKHFGYGRDLCAESEAASQVDADTGIDISLGCPDSRPDRPGRKVFGQVKLPAYGPGRGNQL